MMPRLKLALGVAAALAFLALPWFADNYILRVATMMLMYSALAPI